MIASWGISTVGVGAGDYAGVDGFCAFAIISLTLNEPLDWEKVQVKSKKEKIIDNFMNWLIKDDIRRINNSIITGNWNFLWGRETFYNYI